MFLFMCDTIAECIFAIVSVASPRKFCPRQFVAFCLVDCPLQPGHFASHLARTINCSINCIGHTLSSAHDVKGLKSISNVRDWLNCSSKQHGCAHVVCSPYCLQSLSGSWLAAWPLFCLRVVSFVVFLSLFLKEFCRFLASSLWFLFVVSPL